MSPCRPETGDESAKLLRNQTSRATKPQWAVGAAAGDETVEAKGKYLAPGFIDLHTHGLHRHLADNGPEDLAAICRIFPRYGVTGVLPCVCPLPKGKDAEFVSGLAKVRSAGASILGLHLEGPFLTLTGALPARAARSV